MKRLLLAILILCALPCFADERAQGFCMVGGQKSITQGLQSTNDIMASYPQCQVNVYLAGTTTPATIFSDNGVTVLTNPFTANTDASWGFYAADGHYDVVLSGGQAGGFPVPFTLSYIFLNSGGGGSDVTVEVNGVVVPPSVYNFVNGNNISITNPSGGIIQIDSTGGGGVGCAFPATTVDGQMLYTVGTGCASSPNIFVQNATSTQDPATATKALVFQNVTNGTTDDVNNLYLLSAAGSDYSSFAPHLWQMSCSDSGRTTLGCQILMQVDDSGVTIGAPKVNPIQLQTDITQAGNLGSIGVNVQEHLDATVTTSTAAYEGVEIDGPDGSGVNTIPKIYGFYSALNGGSEATTEQFGYLAETALGPNSSPIASNYCDFVGREGGLGTSQIREQLGCGPTFTSTFKGPVTVPNLTVTGTCTGCGVNGVTSINTTSGAFTFNFSAGAGSCAGTSCTFTGSGAGGGSVTSFIANAGSWPTWLVPTVTLATTTPTLAVAASAIPNSALANASTTINGVTCTLGSTCSVAAPTFQTNSVSNTAQTGLNFINPSSFNGLSFTYSNPSTNQETFAVGGTLGNAGLTNSTITLGSTSVALGATVSSVTGLNTTGTSGGLTGSPAVTVSSITDTALTSGNCLQAAVGGHIVDTGVPCGSGSGGSGITALTGDVNASGTGSVPAVVKGINGVIMASLTTGLLKNTTSTGVPTIAVAGTDYLTPTGVGTGLTALNASNLGSGTVPAARLPSPTPTTLGGIQSQAAFAHQWINGISTSGVPSVTQPAFSDISGVVATAQLPLGTSGAPGALQCGSGTTCSGGVITATGGSGISGLTTGFLPKAASSTAIGNSLIDEGITTANTATVADSGGLNVAGTGASIIGFGGPGVTLTKAGAVTSATCVSSCLTARGSFTVVAGTATTGTLVTVSFNAPAPSSAPVCGVSQSGGTSFIGLGHGTPTTSGFTVNSAVSAAGQTFTVDYWCAR